METKELMIGNLLKDKTGRRLFIDEIYGDEVYATKLDEPKDDAGYFMEGIYKAENLMPVEITTENLKYIGFEMKIKDTAMGATEYMQHRVSDVLVASSPFSQEIEITSLDMRDQHCRVRLKYIHQLQNLVMAMFGAKI